MNPYEVTMRLVEDHSKVEIITYGANGEETSRLYTEDPYYISVLKAVRMRVDCNLISTKIESD